MKSFQFYNPTKILCGEGIFDKLPKIISNTYKDVFIVTDSNIINILGGKDKLEYMFIKENINVSIYDNIKPDPSYDDINNVTEIFKTISGDVIVAIGGGSVIDAAKGISIIAKHGGNISNYIGDNLVPTEVTPIISVPTTSGTGSETTPFAVFTNTTSRKDGLYSEYIFPTLSILDEPDSGLDVDALRIVANGINQLHTPSNSILLVTHYQRILNYVVPDKVHVLINGRIVKSGGKDLAKQIEEQGYDWIEADIQARK